MTNEQAIKLLRKETSVDEIHRLEVELKDYDKVTDKIQEACDMGVEAIEKQIGKKPLHSIYYPNGRKHHHIYCGKCGMYRQRVSMSDNYCRNCGTKIDWSEADEN
jgi:hypothetical protein